MKTRYNPRNRNQPVDDNRLSWSSAFDRAVERRRETSEPCGFVQREGGTKS